MKKKKSPSWAFRWTVITVLSLIGVCLAHDFRRTRALFATPETVPEVTEPSSIIRRTIQRIETLKSVTAKIDMQVHVGPVSIQSSGKYEELFLPSNDSQQHSRAFCYGGTSLFRLHLEIPRTGIDAEPAENGEDNILDIVCDKNTLWTYTSIEGNKKLTELKLSEMAAILAQAVEDEDVRDRLALDQMSFPCPLAGFPGLGGITGSLRRLLSSYDFTGEAESVSMKGKNGSLRAWRLTGCLKPEVYEKSIQNLLGTNSGARRKYMDQFPDVVEIYISQQYEFPYRICYYSAEEMNLKKKEKLITLDMTDVYEDHFSVVPENFIYSPGGLTSTDITRSYIEKLVPGLEF